MEIWKDVVGYEGYYQVSNYGRIKSLVGWSGNKYIKREKILKQCFSSNGYYMVRLSIKNRSKLYRVHLIVISNFIRERRKNEVANHIDGDRLNNHIDNLEWCTQKENVHHSMRLGLKKTFDYNLNYLEEIKKYIEGGMKAKDVAKIYNVPKYSITNYARKNNIYPLSPVKRVYDFDSEVFFNDIKSGMKNKDIAIKHNCSNELVATYKYRMKKEKENNNE